MTSDLSLKPVFQSENEIERCKESLAHIKKKLNSLQEDVSKEEVSV